MIYAEVITLSGTKKPKISLPKKIFGAKINPSLLAQAVRVYLSNQRKARAKAKTRAQVSRTKAKWFRQKGTGRARHGARSAPIFVGGGKAHGPTGLENYQMTLPKKMRRAAIISALSSKASDKEIVVVEGLEKVKKTKEMLKIIKNLKLKMKNDLPRRQAGKAKLKILVVLPESVEDVILATRNIEGVRPTQVNLLNTYEILKARKILITKEALKIMEEKWSKD
ncbi:MAG: 50S ribosomal protein L4 [Patescibacteria group bacterium]